MPDHRHAASDVIRDFHVHKNRKDAWEKHTVCVNMKRDVKNIISENGKDIDGYAIVYYRKTKSRVDTNVVYYLRDPMDAFALPHLAYEQLMKRNIG